MSRQTPFPWKWPVLLRECFAVAESENFDCMKDIIRTSFRFSEVSGQESRCLWCRLKLDDQLIFLQDTKLNTSKWLYSGIGRRMFLSGQFSLHVWFSLKILGWLNLKKAVSMWKPKIVIDLKAFSGEEWAKSSKALTSSSLINQTNAFVELFSLNFVLSRKISC